MNPMSARTLDVSIPTDTTIVMTRAFNAPRRLVWAAMTDPAKLRQWLFAPSGWHMTTCEFDARVGGIYRWTWSDDNNQPVMTLHGVMTEVTPQERIVHTQVMQMHQMGVAPEFTVALQLSESNGRTTMRMTLTFPDKAARDQALEWGMERGMEVGYAKVDAMLAMAQ